MPAQSPTLSPTLSAMARVAGIVLGNAGLDLADQVGADVGALGEDAAAETGEDRDQRGAEAERDQRIGHRARIGLQMGIRRGRRRRPRREQSEAGDQHAGDRARAEGDGEARPAGSVRAASAVRTLARTEMFMPMKPATPESTAPSRKPTASVMPRK
jgi:hypothetical protein